jgi:hypothetical protein
MKRFRLGLAFLLLALPLLAWADGSSDEQEQNRLLLEKWKTDPEKMGRLRASLQAFEALPAERQAQLRRLDRELHEEGSAAAARYHDVLVRYHDWLMSLPAAERQQIALAPDAKERLRRIRELHEQEWIQHLPKAYRDELQKMAAPKRSGRIAELRREESQRRQEWQFAGRHWEALQKMDRQQKFRPEVEAYVRESLLPMLSEDEKAKLARATGQPNYPNVLVELADKHPVKLPGPSTGPSRFEELPPEVKKILPGLKDPGPQLAARVRPVEGKWPDYAIFVTRFAANPKRIGKPLPHPLGPSRPSEFSVTLQTFLKDVLIPKLTPVETELLRAAEGKWPEYPQAVLKLANEHKVAVPGMSLPGPRELWEPFRNKPRDLPEVPERALREFMQKNLSTEERAQLPSLSLGNPETNERVTEQYFQKNPDELRRLRQVDRRAMQKTKSH